MPIGNSNFSQDFLAGASVANMAAQRQERMMQLRAQAALQAVQERQIAQEVDMRSQLFQKQMAEDAQDKADTAAYASILREQMDHATASASMSAQETGEPVNLQKIQADVVASTLPGFAAKNPRAALKFANAVKPVMQEQASLERAQIIAQGGVQKAQIGAESRERIASSKSPTGYAPTLPEKTARALQQADDDVDAAYVSGDPDQIERAEKFANNLRAGVEMQHPDDVKKQELQALRTELGVVLKEYWSGGRDEKLVPKINELKGQIKRKSEAGGRPALLGPGKKPGGTAQAPGDSTGGTARFKLDMKSGRLVPAE